MKFIVDRSKWYRGKGERASRLLREDGQRCCIGFVAGQCNLPDKSILGIAAVHRLPKPDQSFFPLWMKGHLAGAASSELSEAYGVNDRPDLSDADRELRLKRIFERNGDEIEFTN